MEQSKLTQEQITSMSEVVAKYMGYKYSAIADVDNSDCGGIYDRCKVFAKIPIEVDAYPESDQYYIYQGWFNKALQNGGYMIDPDYLDWNRIHEVWEKFKIDKNIKNTILYDPIVTLLAFGTKEQAFTAIYNAIKIIQYEKQ